MMRTCVAGSVKGPGVHPTARLQLSTASLSLSLGLQAKELLICSLSGALAGTTDEVSYKLDSKHDAK